MRALLRPLAGSAAAALAAALAAGLVQILLEGAQAVQAACVAGATSAPAGLALALLVRELWRSWRPLAAEADAAARLAGGLWTGIACALLVGAAGWAGALAAASLTRVPRLAALTVGLFAVGAGAIVVLVSVPAARAATALILRRGLTPARVLRATAALAGGLALFLWLAVLVRAGMAASRGDAIGVAPHAATFLVALAAAHAAGWLWQRRACERTPR